MKIEVQKRKRRGRVGKVGVAILVSLATASFVATVAMLPGLALVVAPFMKKKKYSQKQVVMRNVDSLVRLGLLKKIINEKGEVALELTKRGRWEAMLRHGLFTQKKKIRWDGVWRVIIFDVSNDKNHIRDDLRRAVQMYGFKLLQRSVWVYPHECDDFIMVLKSNLGIGDEVLYMKVTYLEGDRELKKEFSL